MFLRIQPNFNFYFDLYEFTFKGKQEENVIFGTLEVNIV